MLRKFLLLCLMVILIQEAAAVSLTVYSEFKVAYYMALARYADHHLPPPAGALAVSPEAVPAGTAPPEPRHLRVVEKESA